MTKHAAITAALTSLRAAGIPVYQAATPRRAMVPGVAVRLGWRPGTLDVSAHKVDLAPIRAALAGAWTEVYVNEPGASVSVRRA